MTPTILWFRRDLRLADHQALNAAVERGGPVIPLFICDEAVEDLGAAPAWRMGQAIRVFGDSLAQKGSKLILRAGPAAQAIAEIVKETGAGAVYWSRSYDPAYQDRDAAIKTALADQGVEAKSFTGHLLFEPWRVATKTGGFYKVFTPMWKSLRGSDLDGCMPTPAKLNAPSSWPVSETLEDWNLGQAMNRGAAIMAPYARVGEAAAMDRLQSFLAGPVNTYASNRDIPGKKGTSGLSENLTHGEISPLQCWHEGWKLVHQGSADAEVFLKELVWREFAYHLLHHTPRITQSNWREEWDAFPWNTDGNDPRVHAWKRGRTGIQFVDAAMRELYVSGIMHNRARMIVASYLTKHLMSHWKIGMNWFADCLIDWDPASNAMGWQWSAGSGPDATPYFRVFNPETQLVKFDGDGVYANRWLAETTRQPTDTALSYFEAIPRSWHMAPDDRYPAPIVTAEAGRKIALDAYANRGF